LGGRAAKGRKERGGEEGSRGNSNINLRVKKRRGYGMKKTCLICQGKERKRGKNRVKRVLPGGTGDTKSHYRDTGPEIIKQGKSRKVY